MLSATVSQHLSSVQLGLVEKAYRRLKKNQKTKSDYSPQSPIICEEMDRFTTSISRLVFRGLYS